MINTRECELGKSSILKKPSGKRLSVLHTGNSMHW
jgi:hypothetical protein